MAISNAVSLANFTSGDALTVDSANDRVGIASTQPTSTLTVTGDAIATGVVTATTFVGALTGNVTGNTSGTAGGLTGTHNIVVGSVTGTTATFSGSVSVGGTITYEDVANVDSVGVITGRNGLHILDGNVGVGTDNPTGTEIDGNAELVHIKKNTTSGALLKLESSNTIGHLLAGNNQLLVRTHTQDPICFHTNATERVRIDDAGEVGIGTADPDHALHVHKAGDGQTPVMFETGNATGRIRFYNDSDGWSVDSEGDLRFVSGRSGSGAPTRIHINSVGNVTFKSGLVEKADLGTTLQADNTLALTDGNVVFKSSNETGGSQAVNFTGIHGVISTNESVSFTVIITPNGSGLINAVQIDGQSISSLYWSGGSAPSASASGRDVYSFAIIKAGSGATDYEIFASMSNFA